MRASLCRACHIINSSGDFAIQRYNPPRWGIFASYFHRTQWFNKVDFDVTYRVLVGNEREINIDSGLRDRIISQIFEDGSFLYLAEEAPNIMLVVDEENSPIDIEYDIEVFSVGRGPDGADTLLMPLYFQKAPEQVVNGILLDQDEVPVLNFVDLDPSYAEYFFQVNTDLEIPEEEICPRITNLKERDRS